MTLLRPTAFALPLVGWKEHVRLPKLKLGPLVAKVDTGARTASLHADEIEIKGRRVYFGMMDNGHMRRFKAALAGTKRVKSSNGMSEIRPLIRVTIAIGGQQFRADVTLTDRTDMGVAMLLGRATITGRFLVNPARTFLLDRKVKTK
jgi:hypothetical protein